MKTINKLLIFILTISFISCDDVLEKDITNSNVSIIYPTEATSILTNVVNFQWNALNGAKKYHLQVLSQNQSIVKDTLTDKLFINLSLTAGNYKWRVRGENGGYQSPYTFPINFSTVLSNVLTNQQVILNIPTENYYTKATGLTLQWTGIPTATSYDVEVITSGGNQILPVTNVSSGTSLALNSGLTQEANYIWKVKAKNNVTNTETPPSSRTFSIDRTDPNQPSGLQPNNATVFSVNQSITLSWTAIADTGLVQSPISYTIQFANTNTFSTIIRTASVASPATSSTQIFTTPGDYYWRIKAVDSATNESAYTAPMMFKVN